MIQVTKQAVQQWVMIDYLAQKHRFQANKSLFERNYTMSFDAFENASRPQQSKSSMNRMTILSGRQITSF